MNAAAIPVYNPAIRPPVELCGWHLMSDADLMAFQGCEFGAERPWVKQVGGWVIVIDDVTCGVYDVGVNTGECWMQQAQLPRYASFAVAESLLAGSLTPERFEAFGFEQIS